MQEQMPSPQLVADATALDHCVAELKNCQSLAVDTEFMRTDTFYPILGLIQIYDGRHCWLIDPLGVEDLRPLAGIFLNPSIIKVFHSCSEDLEVLHQALGCIPEPLFDTQIAAALCGYGFSRGYAALVADMLDVHVPKDETRSDWLQRPLSDAQLGYAASDVYHLLPVYQQLLQDLAALTRTDWMAEEMQDLTDRAKQRDDGSEYYRKVKGAWRLPPEGLLILQHLCEWREREARVRNRPRNRVLPDRTLVEIANQRPGGKGVLAAIEGMHPGVIRRYGDVLLGLVQKPYEAPPGGFPPPLDSPLPKSSRDLGKALKAVVAARADELQLPVEMLARKRDIEELVRSVCEGGDPVLSSSLASGWRYDVVGLPLLAAVAEKLS
ncbi:MAG: ribonuclease D [Gammaproteobacteria bacterium]|nr:MAG: ribonuclease D [Gammaproteobacteria bacterium]